MATTRLVLVRHGETLANREFRYIGARDDALSGRGLTQALALADALSTFPIAAIYSSPLQRAYNTARPIAAHHQQEVIVADALREGSFGQWEGLSRTEVLARGPEDVRRLLAWEQDTTLAPPDGESFDNLNTRITTFVESLLQSYPEQTVVLVSHVGPIKVLLCTALGAPLSSLFHIFLDPATISVVDWHTTRSTVRLLNSHAHLGWEQPRWLHTGS